MMQSTNNHSVLRFAPLDPTSNLLSQYSSNAMPDCQANPFLFASQQRYANAQPPNPPPIMQQPETFDAQTSTGMVFLNDTTEQLKKIMNSGPVRCWDHGCDGRQFSSLGNYRRHLKERAQASKRFYCPRCHRSFSRSTARNDHFDKTKCKMVFFDKHGLPITVPFVGPNAAHAEPGAHAATQNTLSYPQINTAHSSQMPLPISPDLQPTGMEMHQLHPHRSVENGRQPDGWEFWLDNLMAA